MNLDGYPGLLRRFYYARFQTDEPKTRISHPPEVTQLLADIERKHDALRSALGEADLDAVLEAVFDFDEFTPAAGVPDILVWSVDASCWFFSEVKAPGDSLRPSQTKWLKQHHHLVRGHYVLTILE